MKICETYSGSFIFIIFILLSFATVKDSSSSFDDNEKIYNVFRKQFPLEKQYGVFTHSERLEMLGEAKFMFYHGYDNYMTHAFPMDELNPLDCTGRGPDHDNPDN
eukprot:UN22711